MEDYFLKLKEVFGCAIWIQTRDRDATYDVDGSYLIYNYSIHIIHSETLCKIEKEILIVMRRIEDKYDVTCVKKNYDNNFEIECLIFFNKC